MERDLWKSPLPGSATDLVQALAEKTLRPKDVEVWIHPPSAAEKGTRFYGWTADVFRRGIQPWTREEKTFETLAFESEEAIVTAFHTVGVTDLRFA